MEDVGGRNPLWNVVVPDAVARAWVFFQYVVIDGVAELVEPDAVDVAFLAKWQVRCLAHLGFDQHDIELDRTAEVSVAADDPERFAVLVLGVCHRPELATKLNGFRP